MEKKELARHLRSNAATVQSTPLVTGFDGFVDEMISVVDERFSLDDYRRIETIGDFGEKITAAAGQSSLREIVLQEVSPGGCAINMGDGLVHLGFPVHTFATVGEPLHAAFADYAAKANVHSWGAQPGRTLAYEFADGKLMFSAVSQLREFHPGNLRRFLRDGVFEQRCREAKFIAVTDWSLYPHMTECWRFLQDSVFSKLDHRPSFFIDLVDPSSRAEDAIREMLGVLSQFNEYGPAILGLNQNEANILGRVTGVTPAEASGPEDAVRQCSALREELKLDSVLIHSTRYAAGNLGGNSADVAAPYCESPKKSTGAGDRFNAGFALGHVLDLAPADRLTLGCACSGSFVREARSPTLDELADFLEDWSEWA